MKTLLSILFGFAIASSLALAAEAPVPAYKVDEVRVYKMDHKMQMLFEGKVTKEYFIRIGKGGYRPKVKEGDGKVPEGQYFLNAKNPNSKFFRSIHVSYPNEEDIKRAEAGGYDPGGNIFIHGYPKYGKKLLKGNWSQGCIVVENWEMLEIWNAIEENALPIPITIYP